ncbi:MAG: response regulator transcription factor [Alphaproteobacteria bacterium]|nr:response regulator transcription factor [Alphaproteobacteria bacterium]
MPPSGNANETIAVVDDDALFRDTLCANLADVGLTPIPLASGEAALAYLGKNDAVAAVLLDWHMPGVDGRAVLRRLRMAGNNVPVLFLTGLNQPLFEEAAFAGGAVDFVGKSRSFAIILHRLKLAIGGAKNAAVQPGELPVGEMGGLRLDTESARASWNGHRVGLTLTEFKVVQLLAASAGHDVPYRDIYDRVRGAGFTAGTGPEGYRANVRTLVKRIRQKFALIDPEFGALKTYSGFGYRWSDDTPD